MFKVGEKVICINDIFPRDAKIYKEILKINKLYTVSHMNNRSLTLDETDDLVFLLNRFISLNEHRKQTILKIKDNIKIL